MNFDERFGLILRHLPIKDYEKRTFKLQRYLEGHPTRDIYNRKWLNELVEEDEIEDSEEGFMQGYLQAFQKG